jgi:hypothetical protein
MGLVSRDGTVLNPAVTVTMLPKTNSKTSVSRAGPGFYQVRPKAD